MTTTRPSTPDLPPVPGKRYFTISEVSELTGLTPELLHQWELASAPPGLAAQARPRRHYQHHEVLLVRRMRNALLASRPATTPAPATANGRLGAGSLRAELSSILAWLDI